MEKQATTPKQTNMNNHRAGSPSSTISTRDGPITRQSSSSLPRETKPSNGSMMAPQPEQASSPIKGNDLTLKRRASQAGVDASIGLDVNNPEPRLEPASKRVRQEKKDAEHQQIRVGHRVPDKDEQLNNIEIPVFARLNAASNVTFHLGPEEARSSKIELSYQMIPKFNQIEFENVEGKDFQKGTEKEKKVAIKNAILEDFPPKMTGRSIAAMPSDMITLLAADTIVVDAPAIGTNLEARPAALSFVAPGNQPFMDPFQILNSLDDQSSALRTAMVGQARVLNNTKQEVLELNGKIKGLQDTAAAQKTMILKQAQVIKDQENTKHLLEQSEQRIAELEKQVEGFTKQPMAPAKLIINKQEYDRYPSGHKNEGLYVSRVPTYVTFEGKDYAENAVLCEYKKLSIGDNTGEIVAIGDLQFQRVLRGDAKEFESYIQEFGPRSFFAYEGKDYIRWFIREEHRPKSF